MADLFIHPATKQRLDAYVRDMPQSLAFAGPEGVGLSASVSYVAAALNTKPMYVLPEKDEKTDLEKGVITVDIIRRLYAQTKTVEKGIRLIVIDYAERMGVQAQNAFLKLLEEPGENTHFILLTHAVSKLLPTIRSRVQLLEVKPVLKEQSEELLQELKVTDPQKKAQLLFIANGLPALLTRLSHDDTAFEARAQLIRDARTYLQGSPYERLKVAVSFKDDRQKALTMLLDAMKLLQSSLKTGQNPDQVKMIDTLLAIYERVAANGNVRLQLASIVA
jgi:DNA polymerase-3 subunit delta'